MIVANPDALSLILKARDDQIRSSFDYVASVLEVDAPKDLGPVASAVFADVVSQLNAGDGAAAQTNFESIGSVTQNLEKNARIFWGDDTLPDQVWGQLHRLFDTDAAMPFNPKPPTQDQAAVFLDRVDRVRHILTDFCPDALAEFDLIVELMIMGAPEDDHPNNQFDGCSTFFCPGAILVNAAEKRTIAHSAEMILHEASHVLLFAIAGSDGLTANDPNALYTSPLRPDPRPIEGIFHAAFVTTRVHWVMQHLVAQPEFPDDLRDDFTFERDRLDTASLASLQILNDHCEPTAKGAEVLTAMQTYWAGRL